MRKMGLGLSVGAALGLIDGLSAWAYPEARSMMAAIVVGSTVKGLVTGLIAGLVAVRVRSTLTGVGIGIAVGWALSSLAAQGQPAHYWAIVLPGMLVGALTGFVTQRYPRHSAPSRRGEHLAGLVLAGIVLCPPSAAAQVAAEAPLAPLDFLIGRWEGTTEGTPGSGVVQREYSRVLGGRFIKVENVSTYAPQAKNPKGERHEDIGFFSFDRARKRLVFRQFHVEGFVNHYVADAASGTGPVTFITEAIENIPAGWRARETYTRVSADEIEERFELAEPGKDYEVYSLTRLRRARQ
jgi:hypothetical protein